MKAGWAMEMARPRAMRARPASQMGERLLRLEVEEGGFMTGDRGRGGMVARYGVRSDPNPPQTEASESCSISNWPTIPVGRSMGEWPTR